MLRFLIFIQLFILICVACKCKTPASWKTTFEEAKWVSHVKINSRKLTNDQQSVIYEVSHIEVYKNKTVLDNKILTLSSSSACGIPDLKEGKEYLLAGTYANGNEMRIINCLLFIFQNQSGSTGSFKWEDVPSDLITKLKSGDFD